ncbi:cobalamin-binding protein [Candidatus Bathyarchaeota archaeon]|nr:MAG: cobalamin-binding protein [Candidatus Hecatellales archaeon]RLI34160.1 MAG: cobalamin-binding protein [Candidatus Bathyarchaeota archaeon]
MESSKNKEEVFERLKQAIIEGDEVEAVKWAEEAVKRGIDAYEAISKGCLEGMNVVGDKYARREYFIPEVVLAAQAMNMAVEVLKPHVKMEKGPSGVVVIGTVQGDVHDIGKNIVKIMLEAAGFKVIDLGRDVPLKDFVETAKQQNADIIAMSALMTTTMPGMGKVVKMLEEDENLRRRVKVMIGGAPTSEEYARRIGADAWGKDAVAAVELAKKFMQEKHV